MTCRNRETRNGDKYTMKFAELSHSIQYKLVSLKRVIAVIVLDVRGRGTQYNDSR